MFTAEQVIRHEAGHAVVAHRLARPVKAMVWRARRNGSDAQGDVVGSSAGDPSHLIILAAGLVADYLNSRMLRIDDPDDPFTPTFEDMVDWERDIFTNMTAMSARALADADLKAIRDIRTSGHFAPEREASIADARRQDVQRAIDILNDDWDLLCELVDYAIPRKPGIGPRELRLFFAEAEKAEEEEKASQWACRWARLKDKPGLLLVRLEQWKFRT